VDRNKAQSEQNVIRPATRAVKTISVIRAAERRDHLTLHELTTDIAPRTIESLIVVNAVVHIIFAVESARRQRLLTNYTALAAPLINNEGLTQNCEAPKTETKLR